ncbi:MAG: nucleotidyltransferase domain-containing protein [Thermodesulfovibrionales bacterium]|nr:nucleotidyltransferase domain-containing protein [Thermodesulfovibrionales bacterium]MDP3110598.1 nucleotidyltransferase domain-containing protein [Thermodesulfovibrionales bacterium]
MNQKLEKIKEILRANSNVEFAYLFGSRAKGISGERSDWDIAIYFRKDPRKLSKWTVFSLEAELSKEIGNEVQITVLNNLDSPVFLFQIINDGLLLVDSKPEKRILFEAQTLTKYHDWQYFLKRQMAYK